MKRLFSILVLLFMTIGLSASPVFVDFESVGIAALPTEIEKVNEDEVTKEIEPEKASLFSSTNVIIFMGLVGVYMLFARKREARCNL